MTSSVTSPDPTSELLHPVQPASRHDFDLNPEDSKIWGSKRLMVAIFIFFGYMYLFMLRGNLSIAIIEMTSNKTILTNNGTIIQGPEFSWDSKTKGWILSVYWYAYFFSAIGGYLSTKFGAANIYGFGYLVTGVFTVLTPFTLRTNLYLFAVGRMTEGLFEGFSYACSCDLWSRWIPRKELPLMVAFSHTGLHFGAAITYPLCGYIAHRWGWPMIFYFSGATALIWYTLFYFYVTNEPSSHKSISSGELRYIRRTVLLKDNSNTTYPWRKIFTSKPVWALCACKFAYSWAFSILVLCFPLYIKDITDKTTFEVGILSGIPTYANMIIAFLSGFLVTYLENNAGIDKTKVHKWILCSGYVIGGILLMIVGYTNFIISMVCFVLTIMAISLSIIILQLVAIQISPNHAGVVAGISCFWYTSSSLITPILIGFIVTNHTLKEWSTCFILSGVILILVAIINLLFGSSDDQKWLEQKPPSHR